MYGDGAHSIRFHLEPNSDQCRDPDHTHGEESVSLRREVQRLHREWMI